MINILKYQSEINKDISDEIYFQWIITYKCNYRCDYCYLRENNLLDKNKFVTLENFKLGINKLSRNINVSNCRFDIMGGEPTLHPDLDNILKILSDINFKVVNLNTNGSLLKKYISLISNYNNFRIILSYHPDKCDYNFIELVEEIVKANISLEINVMFPPSCKKAYDMYKYLTNTYNCIDTKVGLITPLTYAEDEYDRLKMLIKNNNHNNDRCFVFLYNNDIRSYTNEEIRLYSLNKFYGMLCFVKHFTIDTDGKINVLCDSSVLNSSYVYFNSTIKYINNILRGGIMCKNNTCGCSIGYNFKKVRQ